MHLYEKEIQKSILNSDSAEFREEGAREKAVNDCPTFWLFAHSDRAQLKVRGAASCARYGYTELDRKTYSSDSLCVYAQEVRPLDKRSDFVAEFEKKSWNFIGSDKFFPSSPRDGNEFWGLPFPFSP